MVFINNRVMNIKQDGSEIWYSHVWTHTLKPVIVNLNTRGNIYNTTVYPQVRGDMLPYDHAYDQTLQCLSIYI